MGVREVVLDLLDDLSGKLLVRDLEGALLHAGVGLVADGAARLVAVVGHVAPDLGGRVVEVLAVLGLVARRGDDLDGGGGCYDLRHVHAVAARGRRVQLQDDALVRIGSHCWSL